MSSLVNKVKEALHGDKDTTRTTGTAGTHSTTHHTSTEPRVDPASNTSTTGTGYAGSDNYTYGTGANRGVDGPATRTDGPHSSNVANKADPRVDSDRDHSRNLGANPQGSATTGHGTTGTTGTTGTHHNTSAVGSGVGSNRGYDGPATRTDGPHSSNLANKADPRVDSDRDHSRNLGANPHGTASTGSSGAYGTAGTHTAGHSVHTGHSTTGGLSGTHGTHQTSGYGGGVDTTSGAYGSNRGVDGPATRTDGPHSSNIANKADPRVDSDRDHSRNLGANPHGTASSGTAAHSSTGHSHVGGTTTGYTGTGVNRGVDGPATRTDGPHSSNIGNKADPRVDSDRDHSRNLGANPHGTASTGTHTGSHTTGTTGTHGTHDTHGTHGSNLTTAGSGPGPAPNTAGPHKSDLLNKADPRVDSDLDGSKTVGGNKTTSYAQRDPTDAAQVPPSVMQQAIGKPTIEHDDHEHGREKRHSVSHQERHVGH